MKSSEIDSPSSPGPYQSPAYRYFVLGFLTLIYVFSFIDRQIVNILGIYIIEDLSLSDMQFGALSGVAFAAIYVIFGIPVARLADSGNRRNIIAISLTVWSGMTALCGMATNFLTLFLARVGVGLGEAGCTPPAHTIISDIFPANKRATMLSIYGMGIFFGVLIGYILGGYLAALFNWRMAFILVGFPGVILAIIFTLVVKEPVRKHSLTDELKPATPSLKETFTALWTTPTFRHLAIACSLHNFVSYGLSSFMPVFLGRVHAMPIHEIGLLLGLSVGLGGVSGTFLGGFLSDTLTNKTSDDRWQLRIPMYSTLLTLPFYWLVLLYLDTGFSAAIFWFVPSFVGGMFLGPSFAVTHSLVGIRMRAVASSVLLLFLNLLGLGVGPLATGWISDLLTPGFGSEAIRYAMAIMVFVNLWCAFHYGRACRTLRSDINNNTY